MSPRRGDANKVDNINNKVYKNNEGTIAANNNNAIGENSGIMPDSTFSANAQMADRRKRSAHLVSGLQKVLSKQHHNNSYPSTSTLIGDAVSSPLLAVRVPGSKKPYHFESAEQKVSAINISNDVANSKAQTSTSFSPISSSDDTMVDSESTRGPRKLPSIPPTSLSTPHANVYPESSTSVHEHAEADEFTSPSTHAVDVAAYNDEMAAALADMRAAEKLLSQRHAVIKPQANTSKRVKPLDIIKKVSARTSSAPVRALSNRPDPIRRRSQSAATANDAIESMQRRQALKNLAFFALSGCPENIKIIESINAHFQLQDRHVPGEVSAVPNVIFEIRGVRVRASQMPRGSVERAWVIRYNTTISNLSLVERRLLSPEDHEFIAAQLFPQNRDEILKPEHFAIYMEALGEEGIFTKAQAKTITNLGVTIEEYEKGDYYTGPTSSRYESRSPDAVRIFDIPNPADLTTLTVNSNHMRQEVGESLYPYLRTLVEAAVYKQKFWNGYFFPNAASKLRDFHQAYNLTEQGWLLPPHLTSYKRFWTYREARLLQRGIYICNLTNKYENGTLVDFGILRAMRAAFVSIPGQPGWCVEDLESFIYHRIVDSGLDVIKIPHMMMLHPDHDKLHSDPEEKARVKEALECKAQAFMKEEEMRLGEIRRSKSSFEEHRWKQLRCWGKMKVVLRRWLGRKQVVKPFNPFDPAHEE
ncbi:hypothetical protein GMOD_00000526 [Pyrenophora seminiperda CCB06]|uniref:Uncharacterized protein n=1 Tax=Pyrenophora seminiperda CCB06 TaxID=1302712 RepID=A0A3M7M7E0_9PLEO|nr:hypothetical protein GMOD_00000526 [Pyrenophora seminiperda CCB06]